ncbi:unnamed protein product [Aphanomyces euteiches]|uniref:Uncharacterized protein n=1 Tax=Aphanomyces euteiches TaxID=100861 RepID=A0A6G0XVX3_9STRA|nr:hypothetical protein Ae201684_001065 [Aphanomyces euteiches]KAH9099281.1 hypothetical protein Ae201684P_018298 [Aphanomyces euteiches]KAH9140154.1 hypothetical protein AeRB84_015537 [Aphanomyces euteiches]
MTSCNRCGNSNVVYLEVRSVWLCANCENTIKEHGEPSTLAFLAYNRPKLSIFVSYGHDPYQLVAMTIKEHLQKRGHYVWVDTEQLAAGRDWESDISEGLQRAKEAKEHGRVLLLMTPYAVRRDGGYCLNEVARAVQLGLSVFPVLVVDCEQPQSIANLPFYDLRDCIPQYVDSTSTPAPLNYGGSVPITTESWDLRLHAALASARFNHKMNRLVGLLELCDTMLAYHVPLIGGEENLGRSHTALAKSESGLALTTTAATSDVESRYFLSYGESCTKLGQRLYRDLVAQGFQVHPLSQHPLTKGMTKEQEYARLDALHWTHALKTGKLVLFVTPGSVGRPHGVCLNEISLAMTLGLNFVPLMIRQCEIPLSICRIQWLDMSDVCSFNATPWDIHDARYTTRQRQLIAALNGQIGLDQEGQQARLFSLLSPFSFQSQISAVTQGYVGRDWVLDEFDIWVKSPPSDARRVFLITGVIGSGKSALAARIIQTRPEIVAFHLASHEGEQTQNGRRCVLNLVYQLTTQLPAYANVLNSQKDPLEEVVFVKSLADLVQDLLITPLETIARPPSTMVILIDGIECFTNADDNLLAMLTTSLSRWPNWIRFIFTSREDPKVQSMLQPYMVPPVALDPQCGPSKRDVRLYLETSLSQDDDDVPPHVIDTLLERTQGLFLYARHLVNAFASGQLTLDNLDNVPTTMGGFLQQTFATQFPAIDKYKNEIRPILEVVCAANEPLTLEALSSIMHLDVYATQKVKSDFGSLFLLGEGGIVMPFHLSLLDWLKDPESAGDYFVDVCHGHEVIGMWCYEEYLRNVRAGIDFTKIEFELETSGVQTTAQRMQMYIVRHASDHLEKSNSMNPECFDAATFFFTDETFLLAVRLLQVRQIGLQSFYHGEIARNVAEDKLRSRQVVGAFLIRYSGTQRSYCVSFIAEATIRGPVFQHNLIYHLPSGSYSIVPPHEVGEGTAIFSDLVSFVEAFLRQRILKEPIRHTGRLNRGISQQMG